MKKITSILILFISLTSFSQTAIKKSSIDSGGASTTNGTLTMVYTLGEVAVQENTNGAIHISEGFLSPDIISTVGLDDYTQLAGVQLYPNPATDFVNLSFSKVGMYEISIYDTLGKKVKTFPISVSNRQRIVLGELPNAIYFILIKNENTKEFISYKLIKQ